MLTNLVLDSSVSLVTFVQGIEHLQWQRCDKYSQVVIQCGERMTIQMVFICEVLVAKKFTASQVEHFQLTQKCKPTSLWKFEQSCLAFKGQTTLSIQNLYKRDICTIATLLYFIYITMKIAQAGRFNKQIKKAGCEYFLHLKLCI